MKWSGMCPKVTSIIARRSRAWSDGNRGWPVNSSIKIQPIENTSEGKDHGRPEKRDGLE